MISPANEHNTSPYFLENITEQALGLLQFEQSGQIQRKILGSGDEILSPSELESVLKSHPWSCQRPVVRRAAIIPLSVGPNYDFKEDQELDDILQTLVEHNYKHIFLDIVYQADQHSTMKAEGNSGEMVPITSKTLVLQDTGDIRLLYKDNRDAIRGYRTIEASRDQPQGILVLSDIVYPEKGYIRKS